MVGGIPTFSGSSFPVKLVISKKCEKMKKHLLQKKMIGPLGFWDLGPLDVGVDVARGCGYGSTFAIQLQRFASF